ncbi:metal-binding protein [Acetobacterium bakii]|uniref:Metal-binding protein n=2 Tax=Acetobacterium bakii TaxID=52689 RepID=A0A0L6U2I4_9FIRM|nr:metal-binding protein [Acetobacterium bakii]
MMIEIKDMLDLAYENGFTKAVELDVTSLHLYPDVREMCAANKCKIYDTNWACPPGCGTLAECEEKTKKYKRGIIVQTTGKLEDSFDFEGMEDIKEKQNICLNQFIHKLHDMKINMLPLGDGCCSLCEKCTYPEKECRFPDQAMSSMEAFGILVSDLCKLNNIPYYYGPNTLTYVGCVLFD